MSDITYIDHDPRGIHGGALHDLARHDHVHVRTSDRCIKNRDGDLCPSPIIGTIGGHPIVADDRLDPPSLPLIHDPAEWRHAFETTEPGPELDRIRARVAAARNAGANDAIVAVVLDEASQWRERALAAEAALSNPRSPENLRTCAAALMGAAALIDDLDAADTVTALAVAFEAEASAP